MAAREKAVRVIEKLRALRLIRAAELVEKGSREDADLLRLPKRALRRIRTNNPLERTLREIRRRTRVVVSPTDNRPSILPRPALLS